MKPIFDGQKLKNKRKKDGLTLTELGGYFGVSHAYMSKLETGKTQPSKALNILLTSYIEGKRDRKSVV